MAVKLQKGVSPSDFNISTELIISSRQPQGTKKGNDMRLIDKDKLINTLKIEYNSTLGMRDKTIYRDCLLHIISLVYDTPEVDATPYTPSTELVGVETPERYKEFFDRLFKESRELLDDIDVKKEHEEEVYRETMSAMGDCQWK